MFWTQTQPPFRSARPSRSLPTYRSGSCSRSVCCSRTSARTGVGRPDIGQKRHSLVLQPDRIPVKASGQFHLHLAVRHPEMHRAVLLVNIYPDVFHSQHPLHHRASAKEPHGENIENLPLVGSGSVAHIDTALGTLLQDFCKGRVGQITHVNDGRARHIYTVHRTLGNPENHEVTAASLLVPAEIVGTVTLRGTGLVVGPLYAPPWLQLCHGMPPPAYREPMFSVIVRFLHFE